jgi:hypothetical protein
VYYAKINLPGIWKVPVEGGEETRLLAVELSLPLALDQTYSCSRHFFLRCKAGYPTPRIKPGVKATNASYPQTLDCRP